MGLPKPVGPYSLLREGGDFIFLAGQIGIDPDSGNMPENVEEQAEIALNNIKNILESMGLKMDNVIKTTIFLTDINDFPKVNEIYARFFKEPYPARSTAAVKSLPKNAKVEIEVIAYKG